MKIRFHVTGRIGTTAGSHLYRAASDRGAPVLLKMLDQGFTPEQKARLRHEYKLLKKLDLPGVAKPLTLIEHDPPMVALDCPTGELMEDVLARGRLDLTSFLHISTQLAAILEGLHEARIIHRDLRPANLLLTPDGRVQLLDLSHGTCDPPDTAMADIPPPADWAYISPEQTGRLNRAVDYRTDLYSLGMMLYRMLTGRLPFEAKDALEWAHCHIARLPRPPKELAPDLPPILSNIVMKLLAKNAEERYQSAPGLKYDLEKCLRRRLAGREMKVFPLAKRDVPDRLLIPQKLYGREREVEALLTAFNRVALSGTPEALLVAGYSGIGKTTLVGELCKPVFESRGYFISGKCDQFKGATPYSGLPDLFRELSRQILTESEERIADWKRRIQEAVGVNGQLIVDILPELEAIIGKQPPVPELRLTEGRNRFNMVFQRFAAVFAKKEHPLVVFIDDLQWIGITEAQLLAYTLTHPDTRYVLLIGAYRDNEVGPSHPLTAALDDIRGSGTPVQTFALQPLPLQDIGHLLADTFHAGPRRVITLTGLLQEKTGGNPFFLRQFLQTLAEERLVEFDRAKGRWRWDIEQIREKGYTDNVGDLMTAKLKKLSDCTLEEMRVAACIGNRFDLRTLAKIGGIPEEETAVSLVEGVREGLLLRHNGYYSFLHDRIQEEVYSLVPERDRTELNLRVGRLLLADAPENRVEEIVFDIVNHLNSAAALLTEHEERTRIAELNLRAAKKAKAAAAYQASISYLVSGIALLGGDQWQRRHDLLFAMHLELAECELLNGAFDRAKGYFSLLLHQARTPVEKAAAYGVKIDAHSFLGESGEAIHSALACLRMLGIDIPAHPSDREVRDAFESVWRNLGTRRIEELVDLPLMTDPKMRSAMEILSRLYYPAYHSDNNLFFLHVCLGVNLSLSHGNSAASTYAYGWFGVLLATVFGRASDGKEFARLSSLLMERHRFWAYRAKVNMFLKFVAYWSQNLDKTLEHSRAMLEAGLETGDMAAACLSFMDTIFIMISRGDSLSAVQREAERGLDFVRRAGIRDIFDAITVLDRFVLAMRGQTRHLSTFDDDTFSEADFETKLREERIPTLIFYCHAVKLMARFIAGDLDAALLTGKKSRSLLWAGLFSAPSHYFHFYYALTLAGLMDRFSTEERQDALHTLAVYEERLRDWARNSPQTFHHAHVLVRAEMARIGGQPLAAMRLYEEAITSARHHGFVQNEALANEIAARFYLGLGLEKIALPYLRDARSCYLLWEADGKVRQLDERFPRLREKEQLAAPIEVDAITVIKGSQAISGEILFSSLLDRLMKIVLENSGAQRGCLILAEGDDLTIAAQARVEGEEINALLEESELKPSACPLSIINHVRRTRQLVILDDASLRNRFSSDEYIVRNQPVSILCLPVLRQAHLAGLLYLENNLVRGAFTADRIAVLEMLAAQAAISLQNSMLYASLQKAHEELEQRVEERTLELQKTQLQCLHAEKLSAIGKLSASIAHELNSPLQAAMTVLQTLSKTLQMDEEDRNLLNLAIKEGNRMKSLILSIQDFNRPSSGTKLFINVHASLDAVLLLLKSDFQLKRIATVLKYAPWLPQVRAIPEQIKQVFLNLLNNAAEACPNGGVISITTRQEYNRIAVAIQDNGIGIEPENIDRIFQPFYTTKPVIKGTGLGLSVAHGIVRHHGGEIRVESRRGEGSTFTVLLPVSNKGSHLTA